MAQEWEWREVRSSFSEQDNFRCWRNQPKYCLKALLIFLDLHAKRWVLSGSLFPAVQRSQQRTSREKWTKSQENVSKGTTAVSQEETAWHLECHVAIRGEEIASILALFSGKQGCAHILCTGKLHMRLCTRLSGGKGLFFH